MIRLHTLIPSPLRTGRISQARTLTFVPAPLTPQIRSYSSILCTTHTIDRIATKCNNNINYLKRIVIATTPGRPFSSTMDSSTVGGTKANSNSTTSTTPPPVAVGIEMDAFLAVPGPKIDAHKLWCLPTKEELALLARTLSESPNVLDRELYDFELSRSECTSNERVRRMFRVQDANYTDDVTAGLASPELAPKLAELGRALLNVAQALIVHAQQKRVEGDFTTSNALVRLIQVRLEESLALLTRSWKTASPYHINTSDFQYRLRSSLIRLFLILELPKNAIQVITSTEEKFPLKGILKSISNLTQTTGDDSPTCSATATGGVLIPDPIRIERLDPDELARFRSESFQNIQFAFEMHCLRAEYYQREKKYVEAVGEWHQATRCLPDDHHQCITTIWMSDARIEVLIQLIHCEFQSDTFSLAHLQERLELCEKFIRERQLSLDGQLNESKKNGHQPSVWYQRLAYALRTYARQLNVLREQVHLRMEKSQEPLSAIGLEAHLKWTSLTTEYLDSFSTDPITQQRLFQPLTPEETRILDTLNGHVAIQGDDSNRIIRPRRPRPTTWMEAKKYLMDFSLTLQNGQELVNTYANLVNKLQQQPEHKEADLQLLINLVHRRLLECYRLALDAFNLFDEFQDETIQPMDQNKLFEWKYLVRSVLVPHLANLLLTAGVFPMVKSELMLLESLVESGRAFQQLPQLFDARELSLASTNLLQLSAKYHQFQLNYSDAASSWSRLIHIQMNQGVLFHALMSPYVQLAYCYLQTNDPKESDHAREAYQHCQELATLVDRQLISETVRLRQEYGALIDAVDSPQEKSELEARLNELLANLTSQTNQAHHQWEAFSQNRCVREFIQHPPTPSDTVTNSSTKPDDQKEKKSGKAPPSH